MFKLLESLPIPSKTFPQVLVSNQPTKQNKITLFLPGSMFQKSLPPEESGEGKKL